jgi:hypothetical protein
LSAFRPLPPFVLVDVRFLDLAVACFLIFSHPEIRRSMFVRVRDS